MGRMRVGATIRILSALVPGKLRREWSRGWEAEVGGLLEEWGEMRWREFLATLFKDAWTMRRIEGRGMGSHGEEGMMEKLWGALRAGFRSVRRSPGFTVVAVLTLGTGLAAATAIFTVVDHVLLRPLPYPDPDRVVEVAHPVPGLVDQTAWEMSVAGHFLVKDRATNLETVGAHTMGAVTWVEGGVARRLEAASVTAETLDIVGARAQLGRLFGPEEDEPGSPLVVLLSHGLWQEAYGGDPSVVGQDLRVEDTSFRIIGVLAPGARLPAGEPEAWIPWQLDRAAAPMNAHYVNTLARLREGASPQGAEAELRRIVRDEFPVEMPGAYGTGFIENTGFTARLQTIRTVVLGDVERTLWLLMAAVGLVLLLAGANVANLFLVRRELRIRETVVRRAIGASRARVRLHLIAESLVVGTAALALALVATRYALPLLQALAPEGLPRFDQVRLGGLSVAVAASVTLVLCTGLGFLPGSGLGTRTSLTPEGGRGSAAGRAGRLRRALVAIQMALAVVLIAGAGLMIRTASALGATDPGFEPEGVMAFDYALPRWEYGTVDTAFGYHRLLLTEVRGLPGVVAAGTIDQAPMSGEPGCWALFHEDPQREVTCPVVRFVSDGYFEAIGSEVVAGRTYTEADLDGPTDALVISRSLADAFYPDGSALGRPMTVGRSGGPYQVVSGILEDVHDQGLTEPMPGIAYFPLRGAGGETPWGPSQHGTLIVRAPTRDPSSLAAEVRQAFLEVNPLVALGDAREFQKVVAASQVNQAFALVLLSIAGAMALVLGTVGLYAVIAFSVSQRRGEIGVRMALGADRGRVARGVLGESVRLVAVGGAAGLALSFGATRILGSLLFGVEPGDPLTLAAAAGLLTLVGLLAAWLPARRAASVDPTRALNGD